MQDADLLIMVGTNYPYVITYLRKILKAIQIDTNPKISDIVLILM